MPGDSAKTLPLPAAGILAERLRLSYALAAARVHAALADQSSSRRDDSLALRSVIGWGASIEQLRLAVSEELSLLALCVRVMGEVGPGIARRRAIGARQATQILHEAMRIVGADQSTLTNRKPRWANGQRRLLSELPAQSRDRARVLVEKSLFPCTVILFAGTVLANRREFAERLPDGRLGDLVNRTTLLELVSDSHAEDPVYRVEYNLACLYASLARFDPSEPRAADLGESYLHLERAIAGARPERRAELRKWAWNDPSLSELVRDQTMGPRLPLLLGPRDAGGPVRL